MKKKFCIIALLGTTACGGASVPDTVSIAPEISNADINADALAIAESAAESETLLTGLDEETDDDVAEDISDTSADETTESDTESLDSPADDAVIEPSAETEEEVIEIDFTPRALTAAEIQDLDAFNLLIDGYALAFEALDPDITFTPNENVQASGSATFSGTLEINADIFDRFSSTATLTANFENGTLTGAHGTMYRENALDGVSVYEGTLAFEEGQVGEFGASNLGLTLRGTLTSNNSTLVVDQELTGAFFGENTDLAILAHGFSAFEESNVILDGEEGVFRDIAIIAFPD